MSREEYVEQAVGVLLHWLVTVRGDPLNEETQATARAAVELAMEMFDADHV